MRSALARAAHKVPPTARILRERDDLAARAQRLKEQLRAARRDIRQLGGGGEAGPGYLFIVTYGRSGSTLLQGVLNSIPGYLVRGENGDILRHLLAYHREACRCRDVHGESSRRRRRLSSWYGIDGYPEKQALRAIRQLTTATVLRPGPRTRVVGFKEIRWVDEDGDEDLSDYVDFLRLVFPKARFVFNTRDLDSVARSKWWAQDPDSREKLARVEKRLLETRAHLGDEAYLVHFDDYVAEPANLSGLFSWLGEPFDVARIEAVLARKHSY